MLGLVDALNSVERWLDPAGNVLTIPSGFYTPGALVSLAAYVKSKNLPRENVVCSSGNTGDYFSAIGLSKAIWGLDDYQYVRHNEGRNYSSLEHLNSPEATDIATRRINTCIRRFVGHELPAEFVALLSEVVGDLHDNVWAHGKASGFSMAQKWKVPKWQSLKQLVVNDHFLEFALADCGIGFLREVQNAGLKIDSDQQAIDWCIQKEHSTKKLRPASEWAQRLPADVTNNPLRGIETTRTSDNHHAGLGLFKLTQLIQGFGGELWLATGQAVYVLAPDREPAYIRLTHRWQGVAIACRFRSSQIQRARGRIETADKDIEQIMQTLGGRHD